MCGIYLNRDNVCKFLGKNSVKLLKFVKPFSDKKLQTISFWQLEKKKYIYGRNKTVLYLFLKKKKKLY